MKRTVYQISMKSGAVRERFGYPVPGTYFAVWGRKRYWKVDHLPSGYNVPLGKLTSRTVAIDRAIRLHRYGKRIGVLWQKKKPVNNNNRDKLRAWRDSENT